MKITSIKLQNIRGFLDVHTAYFSTGINVFIGANNAGKSTILNSIFLLQRATLNKSDITLGQTSGQIELYSSGTHGRIGTIPQHEKIIFRLENGQMNFGLIHGGLNSSFNRIPETEPLNLIYPYLSKRKTVHYQDAINEENANSVHGNFTNLYSKIDRLITPQFQPGNRQYIEACNQILGFEISTLALGSGKKAVYYVHNTEHIPLTAMGEGVANILGLITDLCVAENKIFLIEEPENDIHPKALKALLKLILEKSDSNQFFISTHSNIVMKYLGSTLESKIFNITNNSRDNERQNLFISKINEISSKPEDRRQVLEDLGYDFFDFDLWKAWLFLEESSAEVLIRDFFIRWYVKPLSNKIRTFSAGGASSIITKFEDFDKLFVFLHLEPTYKNKVWVLIDAGDVEAGIISRMREKYTKNGWKESNFAQLSHHDFERYYPLQFQGKVDDILKISDRQNRRKAKKELLNEVKLWITSNESLAKEQFKESAQEVIQKLKDINKELNF